MRINQVQVRLLSPNLPPKQQMHVEAERVPLQRGAVNVGNPAHAVSYDAGSIIERTRLGKSAAGVEIISQQSDDRLADGEAAAGQNYKHSLPRLKPAGNG